MARSAVFRRSSRRPGHRRVFLPPDTTLIATGIASGEAFGSAVVTPGAVTLAATGIPPAEAFGAATVAPGDVALTATGIPTAEAFGSAVVFAGLGIVATGIGSDEAFGSATVTPGPVSLAASGLPSGEAFGAAGVAPGQVTLAATGIPPAEAFGAATVAPGTVTLIAVGIASPEAFGSAIVTGGLVATGIVSGEVFGAATILGSVLFATGIPPAEAFGAATVTTVATVSGTGIGSAAAFGASTVTPVIGEIATALLLRPVPIVAYELVCVARVPQPSGPPVLTEIDPIDWTGLSYTETLSRAPTLTAGASVSGLTEPVLQRLRTPEELATEIWLYRNGQLVFAGPLFGLQVQGETLTLQAQGLLAYLRLMVVTEDLVYVDVDQLAIATGLVDHWQSLEYGHYGIDTSGVAPSGVTRDATYLRTELHPIGQRVEELGARQDGFDIAVDPSSRRLELSYPQRGVDRSSGEDAVVFDDRNVTSPNLVCSVAPGDVASEAIGTGTGGDGTLYSTRPNLALRARYGRSAVTSSYDGVSRQGTLDAHTQGLLDARARALFVPGPDLRVTPDADVSAYGVGDTVAYQLHARLGVTGAYRLRRRTVTVSKTGQEAVSPELV